MRLKIISFFLAERQSARDTIVQPRTATIISEIAHARVCYFPGEKPRNCSACLNKHCESGPTKETLNPCDCQADTGDTTSRTMSQPETLDRQCNQVTGQETSVTAGSQHLDSEQSCTIKPSSCDNTTQTTKSSPILEAPSTGTERVFCPFFDEHVKEISNKLWLPTLTASAEQHSHWCVGSFKNTVSDSWFTIQTWTPQRSSSQTNSSQRSQCLSADFMDDVRIKIGPTDEELTEEAKKKKKEAAAKRMEEKKRKVVEKAAAKTTKRQKVKTAAQIEREEAAARKREAKLEERERRTAEREAARAYKAAKRPPPTADHIEARKKAIAKKEARKTNAANASRKIRLRPSREMRCVLKMWMGCYRVIYNRSLEISKATSPPKSFNYAGFVRAAVCNTGNISEPWLKDFPSACRKLAAKDLCDAFWSNHAKRVKSDGQHDFKLRFKSKKDQSQTLKVEAAHINLQNGWMNICPRKSKSIIENICREAGIVYDDDMMRIRYDTRQLPNDTIDKDVVITLDKLGRFWMHCPYKKQAKPDNQGRPLKWTALDPGNRVFLTGYDPFGESFKLGVHACGRVIRLCTHLDELVSKTDLLKNAFDTRWSTAKKKQIRQKNSRMKKAQQRIRDRVKSLVAELHWKCAIWLCTRYTDIILPFFSTSDMVCKNGGRRVNSKTARGLMTFSHYSFRQRLIHVASHHGSRVHLRHEDYTSKTCTNCGYVNDDLGSKEVFQCPECHLVACRDGAASRNIFLKNTTIEFTT